MKKEYPMLHEDKAHPGCMYYISDPNKPHIKTYVVDPDPDHYHETDATELRKKWLWLTAGAVPATHSTVIRHERVA